MANKIVVNTGKLFFGDYVMTGTGHYLDLSAVIHLFTNNYTIIETTVLANLTELSSGNVPGYAATTLGAATDGGIDANDRDTWTWPTVTFQATGTPSPAETVYGYYVTDGSDEILLWAENFTSPFTFTNNGDGFTLTPTFSFGSIF